jgi:RNA polymerase sigma-70 factor (ECF subfamily)
LLYDDDAMYPMRPLGRTAAETDLSHEAPCDDAQAERRAIEAVLAGEHGAFRVLVERYHRGVYVMIFRLVSNSADAEDLAQQAFVSAFDALGSFKLELRFSTWLYRIGLNLAKDHLKSKKRSETSLGDSDVGEAAFAGRVGSTDERVHAHERERLLARAFEALSFADREILVLKDMEERSFEEIKDIVRSPVTALKIRAVRARARLKKALLALAPRESL